MFQIIINAMFRTVIAYLLLLVVARFMGRKALSQMTFFDFAVIITLGSVTANLAMGQNSTPVSATTTLLTLGALALITGCLHIKSVWVRKLTNSEPVTAIENGRILDRNLKKVRYTMNELTSLLREKDVFNIADVEFAIIENHGQLSVQGVSNAEQVFYAGLDSSGNLFVSVKQLDTKERHGQYGID